MSEQIKVLLVEDDTSLRGILKEYLQKDGFRLLEASSGDEAVSMISQDIPDILILDIILPRKSGLEVLETVRGNPETRMIPAIILTNLDSAENISRSIELGASMYLIKSDYEPDDIVSKVRKVAKELKVRK